MQLEKLHAALEADLEAKDSERAFKTLTDFHKVELGTGAAIDILNDQEAVLRAFCWSRLASHSFCPHGRCASGRHGFSLRCSAQACRPLPSIS